MIKYDFGKMCRNCQKLIKMKLLTLILFLLLSFHAFSQKIVIEGNKCNCEYFSKKLEQCWIYLPKNSYFKTRNNENIIPLSLKPILKEDEENFVVILGGERQDYNKINDKNCKSCIGSTYLKIGDADTILRYLRFRKLP